MSGICLIRLEKIRPKGLPPAIGIASENAAHRVAVTWTAKDGTKREGVYVARRDTGSRLNALAGGRVFPGEHHAARFCVTDDGKRVDLQMRSAGDGTEISVCGHSVDEWPTSSCFSSLAEASRFFEGGCVGYSVTADELRLDGLELCIPSWRVSPFEVEAVHSTFFDDRNRFPDGSISFDHCLIMRDVSHEWRSVADFHVEEARGDCRHKQ